MSRLTEWLFDKPRVAQGEVFSVLDVGTSKIACFIARMEDQGQPRLTGIGHQLAEGVRGGMIADMEAFQRAITAAVATAEQMAGETIERVTVNIAGPQIVSQTAAIELPLHGREITPGDLERLLSQGQMLAPEDSQGHALELIHTIPVHYMLDGQKGIRDPLGMIGNVLHTQLHLASAAFGPVRTLITAVARCHLEVERLVVAPYASGLSCLVEDEMDLGCTVIDMGAGTTSLAIFADGRLMHVDGVPLGGGHITNDIARGLTTTLAHAERLKTLYGSAIPASLDEREIIDVPQVGEEAPEFANHVPKSHLIRVIQPRLEETFEMVRVRLEKSGLNDVAGRRAVLTGGASQLPGTREVAQRLLDKQVRLGRPLRITRPFTGGLSSITPMRHAPAASTGLAEATSGPAFATTAGLLAVAQQPDIAAAYSGIMDFTGGGNVFTRLGQWVKQNL